MSKTPYSWNENLILSLMFHLREWRVLTAFLSTSCIKMHRCFSCPKNVFKGLLLKLYFYSDPFLISNDAISLSFNRFCHKLSQIMRKWLFLTMTFTFIQKSRNQKTNWEWITCILNFASKYMLYDWNCCRMCKMKLIKCVSVFVLLFLYKLYRNLKQILCYSIINE